MEVDHKKEEAHTSSSSTNVATTDIVASASATASTSEPTSIPNPLEVNQEKGEEMSMEVDHRKEEAHTSSSTNIVADSEVDHENEQAHTSSSSNVALVAAPAWLTPLNMDSYLEECSDLKAWQGLVQSLYRYEERNSITGVHITIIILPVF